MKNLTSSILNRIPVNALRWSILIEKYPLKESKIKVILRSDNKMCMGILTDHLLSVANKLGIPNIYIQQVSLQRKSINKFGIPGSQLLGKLNKGYTESKRLKLYAETHKLLIAVIQISK